MVCLCNPETGEELHRFAEEGINKTWQLALFSPDARYGSREAVKPLLCGAL